MKLPRNEKGMTLVEVLAVVLLLGIVSLLIIGIHLYSQNQFQSQKAGALQLTDITIAMKEITQQIRTDEVASVTASKIAFKDDTTFSFSGDILYKNDQPYIYNIEHFYVEKSSDNEVYIQIRSTTGKELETTLIIR